MFFIKFHSFVYMYLKYSFESILLVHIYLNILEYYMLAKK